MNKKRIIIWSIVTVLLILTYWFLFKFNGRFVDNSLEQKYPLLKNEEYDKQQSRMFSLDTSEHVKEWEDYFGKYCNSNTTFTKTYEEDTAPVGIRFSNQVLRKYISSIPLILFSEKRPLISVAVCENKYFIVKSISNKGIFVYGPFEK